MVISIATLVTFGVYLVGMLLIGIVCYKKTNNVSDYLLGGRQLGGWVAAMSAGASDMSSWLLLGLPGAFYAGGLGEIWLPLGLAIGVFLNWQFVAPRLRKYTEVSGDSITISEFLENRFRDRSKLLRIISAIVILLFFAFYTSAGLVGGAILFEKSFGLTYSTALLIGAAVIIAYTFLGGFLAVSWTDFFQGILMFLALVIVPIVAIFEMGGLANTFEAVQSIDSSYLNVFEGATTIGVISLLAWGLGYSGQPHIITRFMAVKNIKEVKKGKIIGVSWTILSMIGAMFTGLVGIAYLASNPLSDPEAVFLTFTQVLFNPWVAGFLLAAVLSAIMSTIDSQLLVSSSSLAEDFYKGLIRQDASEKEVLWVSRLGVLGIAIIAILLAQNPESSILDLVGYAWAGLGAAFGPVIILSLFWKQMTRNGALAGMIAGGLTVIIWGNISGGLFDLYELAPGFLFSAIAIFLTSMLDQKPSQEIEEEFERATA